jgi:hypothetical protein
MLIEALFAGVLSAAPQVAPVDPSAPIVLCDDHGKKDGKDEKTGKDEEKKDESKPEAPKPSFR